MLLCELSRPRKSQSRISFCMLRPTGERSPELRARTGGTYLVNPAVGEGQGAEVLFSVSHDGRPRGARGSEFGCRVSLVGKVVVAIGAV